MNRDKEMVRLYQQIEQLDKRVAALERDKTNLAWQIENERQGAVKKLNKAMALMTGLIGQIRLEPNNSKISYKKRDHLCYTITNLS